MDRPSSPMNLHAPPARRRTLLLLLAVLLVPSTVVAVLGMRIMVQERELAERRRDDHRGAVAREIGRALVATLERERAGTDPRSEEPEGGTGSGTTPLLFTAPVEHGELRLPWDGAQERRSAARFTEFLRDERLLRAERAELAGDAPGAVELYERMLPSLGSGQPVGQEATNSLPENQATGEAYTRLLLSRALRAAGRRTEARELERLVLETNPLVRDEHGVPISLYAARRWLDDEGADAASVRPVLERVAGAPGWLSPPAIYLLNDLAASLGAASHPRDGDEGDPLAAALAEQLARTEHVLELARDLRALEAKLAGDRGGRRWAVHGEPPWLVGRLVGVIPSPSHLLVLDGESLLSALRRDGVLPPLRDVRLASASDPSALPLHPDLPGLRAAFQLPDDPAGARRARWQTTFLGSSIALVLGLSVLGGWLVWRDVRREVRMASLRSSFVSNVSHELRTPLAAIGIFTEFLRERHWPEPERRYVETIAGESERLGRLVDNVLEFAKVERGETHYRMETTDLADVVREASSALRYLFEKDGFELALEVDHTVPPVMGDADTLERAVLNLLTNAMKYSGRSRSIGLRLDRRNGHAVIEVTDRGIGIDAVDRERIFEAFYRAPSAEREGVPGTGLGLTLVRQVMDAHQGFVTVESEPSAGSTFALHVPLATSSTSNSILDGEGS